ncbi:MAG: hypothetical protein H7242_06720, partial [Microbacteriaceae bacterium]|nr:hypothetical protein [Burkholderiaceae bacterium]
MTTDHRPVTPIISAEAQIQQRRRAAALTAAAGAAVGVGALLGHGLGQSLASALPAAWQAALPTLVGAAVAAMLVPLAGWAGIRNEAPTLPARRVAASAAVSATGTPLRAAAVASRASPQADEHAPTATPP